MIKDLRIGLAQINTTVGDFKGNQGKISQKIREAEKDDVDLLVFPEMAISGYPPSDLLQQDDYLNSIESVHNNCIIFIKSV